MQSSAKSQDNQLDIESKEIARRKILDGDVFELHAYGQDKQELRDEGQSLLNKGFSGIGLKTIREYVLDETQVDGVYGLWIR